VKTQNELIQSTFIIKILKQLKSSNKTQLSKKYSKLINEGLSKHSIQKIISYPKITKILNVKQLHFDTLNKVVEGYHENLLNKSEEDFIVDFSDDDIITIKLKCDYLDHSQLPPINTNAVITASINIGKTYSIVQRAKAMYKDNKTLIIVCSRLALCEQYKKGLNKYKPYCYFNNDNSFGKGINITTIDSFNKVSFRLLEEDIKIDLVIQDEYQSLSTDTGFKKSVINRYLKSLGRLTLIPHKPIFHFISATPCNKSLDKLKKANISNLKNYNYISTKLLKEILLEVTNNYYNCIEYYMVKYLKSGYRVIINLDNKIESAHLLLYAYNIFNNANSIQFTSNTFKNKKFSKDFSEYNLILFTSVVDNGVSIEDKIPTVVLTKVSNDNYKIALQKAGRVRSNVKNILITELGKANIFELNKSKPFFNDLLKPSSFSYEDIKISEGYEPAYKTIDCITYKHKSNFPFTKYIINDPHALKIFNDHIKPIGFIITEITSSEYPKKTKRSLCALLKKHIDKSFSKYKPVEIKAILLIIVEQITKKTQDKIFNGYISKTYNIFNTPTLKKILGEPLLSIEEGALQWLEKIKKHIKLIPNNSFLTIYKLIDKIDNLSKSQIKEYFIRNAAVNRFFNNISVSKYLPIVESINKVANKYNNEDDINNFIKGLIHREGTKKIKNHCYICENLGYNDYRIIVSNVKYIISLLDSYKKDIKFINNSIESIFNKLEKNLTYEGFDQDLILNNDTARDLFLFRYKNNTLNIIPINEQEEIMNISKAVAYLKGLGISVSKNTLVNWIKKYDIGYIENLCCYSISKLKLNKFIQLDKLTLTDKLLSVNQVMKVLNKTSETIVTKIKKHNLGYKIGQNYYIIESRLDNYIKQG